MSLCKYSDFLGAPGTGVHSIRIFNIAVIDLFMTVIIAWYLARRFKMKFLIVFFVLMMVAVFLHRLFCVNTTVDKWLFGPLKV